MSALEIRNEIIRENLPQLIKQLTGFEESDENFRHCENFAWSIIRNHRNLSVNSHEVKRKIEGIQEKFLVANYKIYSDHLAALCEKIIHDPLCVNHYEVDVQWSLLELLLTLAYNPVGALRNNKDKIDLDLNKICEKSEQIDIGYWKNVLKEDFIPLETVIFSDSDLSDWSDEHSSETLNSKVCQFQKKPENICNSKSLPTISGLPGIKPPSKTNHFIPFDCSNSKSKLLDSVQHSWWLPSYKGQTFVGSEEIGANFCVLYTKFLCEDSNNLIRFEEPSTIDELCLLREIIWMFNSPQTCKFFNVSANPTKIHIQENVSIPSITVNGLSIFLEQHFVPRIRMMDVLKSFTDSVYCGNDKIPPKTLECYASNLKSLLQPVWDSLLEYERRLSIQKDKDFCTLIQMLEDLKASFQSLEIIYGIHMKVILDFKQHPAHIVSAYLLCSLIQYNAVASCAKEANFAISLFLTSVKVFCIIIDTWWSEGRLDDWEQEFLIERTSDSDRTVSVRQFSKNKETFFFVPTKVSKILKRDSFFNLLLNHSREAGCTLNLLFEINKISALRNAAGVNEGKLYTAFMDDILASVKKFKSAAVREATEDTESSIFSNNKNESETTEFENEKIIQCLATNDELLIMTFASTMNLDDYQEISESSCKYDKLNALEIFTELQSTSEIILPLENIILSSLSRILKERIAFANAFVIELYRNEFGVQRHLQNIRKVLLLESSDLMHQFYDKLFIQIESGQNWANPFTLTTQLNDILSSKFPDISSLYRVEINSSFRCQTIKVCEAVNELILTYNLRPELSHVITENDLQEYNKVFRFLLKVKWAITTLEKLQIPRSYKRHAPYARLEMIDIVMRRLAQIRFWMIYAIQSIHFHLMTHVLQSMGHQLDEKISSCTNLQEMNLVHKSYISTVYEHCFISENNNAVKVGIEQLLNLVFILRLEWNSCSDSIEKNTGPLAVVLNVSNDLEESEPDNYLTNSQIDGIELTYIRCHQYLVNLLNTEVYIKKKTFLSGLSAAFTSNIPY